MINLLLIRTPFWKPSGHKINSNCFSWRTSYSFFDDGLIDFWATGKVRHLIYLLFLPNGKFMENLTQRYIRRLRTWIYKKNRGSDLTTYLNVSEKIVNMQGLNACRQSLIKEKWPTYYLKNDFSLYYAALLQCPQYWPLTRDQQEYVQPVQHLNNFYAVSWVLPVADVALSLIHISEPTRPY